MIILLPSQFVNSRDASERIRQDGAGAVDWDDIKESAERRGEADGGVPV